MSNIKFHIVSIFYLLAHTAIMQDEDSLDFGGTSNDYMSIPDVGALVFGDGTTDVPFSVEAWSKFDVVYLSEKVSNKLV